MTALLTPSGYTQTKEKLAKLQYRLGELESRKERPRHIAEVRRSYLRMIQQYTREIKLHEASMAAQTVRLEDDLRTKTLNSGA